jgi:preprotein translocase subunit SecD
LPVQHEATETLRMRYPGWVRASSGSFMQIISRLKAGLLIAILVALASPASAEVINLEVASSSVERDKTTNDVVVTIELSPDAKTAFENFTQRNQGRNIEIRIGTTVLLKARLVEKISGGTIRANTKFSEDEGNKVASQLTRGTLITLEDRAD